jgi:hypothetical protein
MGQVVWVTEPLGVARKVPTSPVMFPSVQVTAALASTTKSEPATAVVNEGAVKPDGESLQAAESDPKAIKTASCVIGRLYVNMVWSSVG